MKEGFHGTLGTTLNPPLRPVRLRGLTLVNILYRYPDVITLPLTEILTKVSPRSRTGRVYTLTQKESKAAADKFETRIR